MTTELTPAQRYIHALAGPDLNALDDLYDEEVVFYTPFARGVRGRPFIKAFITEFHKAHPGVQVALHEEFYSADGTRAALRLSIHWHNTGPFFGNPPTDTRGIESEIHTLRFQDGRIVEQWVGHNTLDLTYHQLVTWGMKLPEDTVDPHPAIVSAGPAAAS